MLENELLGKAIRESRNERNEEMPNRVLFTEIEC